MHRDLDPANVNGVLAGPFDWVALLLNDLEMPELQDPESFDWWTTFHHKLVIYQTLVILGATSQTLREETVAYLLYTLDEFQRFIVENVQTSRPDLAQRMLPLLLGRTLVLDTSQTLFGT